MSTPTPSSGPALAERIVETVRTPHRTEEQLQQLLTEIQATSDAEKPQILDALKRNLDGLNAQERALIQANLQDLERRTYRDLVAADLEQLRGVTEAMRTHLESLPPVSATPAQPESAPAPAVAPAERQPSPPQVPSAAEKKWYKPHTWTPEEQKRAAMYAGTGAVVVGGLLLARWIGKGLKQRAHQAGAIVGKGWGWIKWGALAGVLTVGGYFGINAAGKYLKGMAMKKLQVEFEEVQRKLTQMEGLTAAEFGKLMQRKNEIEAQLRQAADAVRLSERPVTSQGADVPVSGSEAVSEFAEIVENPTDIFLARAILANMDDRDWGISSGAKIYQMGGLLLNNGDKPMSAIFEKLEQNVSAEEILIIPESDRSNRMQGAELLLSLCAEKEPEVLAQLVERDGISPEQAQMQMDAMTLKEYLRYAVMESVTEVLYGFTQQIEQGQDIVQALRHLDLQTISRGNQDLQRELQQFVREHAAEFGLTEEETAVDSGKLFAIAAASSVNSTVADRIEYARRNPAETLEDQIIAKVFEEIQNGDTHLFILPCFHDIFPSNEGDTDAERVRTYLLDRMPPHQALRLYFYKRMMKQGNPTGLILMQMEVLKFVADADERWFSDRKYRIIQRIAKKLAGASGETLQEEWQKLGVSMSYPEMFEKAVPSLVMIGKTVGYTFVRGGVETMEIMSSIVKEWPLPALGATIAVGEASRFVTRPFITYANVQDGLKSWHIRALNTDPVNRVINASQRMIGGPSVSAIGHAADCYKKFESALDNTALSSQVRSSLKELLNRCTASPHNKALWMQLAAEFRQYGLIAERNKALLIARQPALRHAINIQRFVSIRGSFLAPPLRGFLRQYERGRSAAMGISSRIISHIPVPARLARLGKVVKGTVVLDTAAVGYEAYDYFQNERPRLLDAIDAETDPAKKAQLERELNWGNTASLEINAAGTALLYSPGMPIGVAMLATNNLVAQPIRRNIEAGTKRLLRNEQELSQETPGAILHHIQQEKTWGQALAADPAKMLAGPQLNLVASDMSETFDKADATARMQGYAGYFRQAALWSLPPLAEDDLSESDRGLPPEKREERIAQRLRDEMGYFATAAVTYLKEKTQKTFVPVDPETVRKAELYARIRTLEQRAFLRDPAGNSRSDERSWEEKEAEVEEAYAQVEALQVMDIASLAAHPSLFREHMPWKMLLAVQHELAACEAKILSANYSNWTDRRSWSWMPGRGQSEESLRAIARGAFAERALTVLRDLSTKAQSSTSLTPEDVASAITALRISLLDDDPNEIALQQAKSGQADTLAAIGADTHLLSVEGLLQRADAILPRPPPTPVSRPERTATIDPSDVQPAQAA